MKKLLRFNKWFSVFMLLILVSCVLTSCEEWYSYCFNINNYTSDSIEIRTTPFISNYKLQIHNFTIRDTGEQGFSEYIDHPIDTVFVIPPKATLSAFMGWYSHHSPSFVPEKDGVIPLWNIIRSVCFNGHHMDSSVWDNETKWQKAISNDDTVIEFDIDIKEIQVSP